MVWLALLFILGCAVVAGFKIWQRWIRPWRHLHELVAQIGRGEQPRTFLIEGGEEPRRLAVELEDILLRQRQLSDQIAQRQSGTETILGAMEDALLVVDPDRRVRLTNSAFQKLFEVNNVEIGASLMEVLRDAALDRAVDESLRSGALQQLEMTAHERRLQVSAVPMKENGASDGSGAVILFHDITELKKIDQMRSDFVANVSHELRTPLSILRGYIETLLDAPDTSTDEARRILRVMERHSQRLEALVNDLLTLAQLESPTPRLQVSQVEINRLIENVAHDWQKKLGEKKLSLRLDLASDLDVVAADDARLQEVLYNLLDNAVKYTPEGGEIRLVARASNGELILAVQDTGVGIPKADLARVFERFYRVDKARSREMGGTGLGLSIVKHIAQLHGGRVEAESELGKGTTIRVIMPANKDRSSTPKRDHQDAEAIGAYR